MRPTLSGAIVLLAASLGAAAPVWPANGTDSDTTAAEALAGVDLSGKTFLTTGADGHIASQLNLALAKQNATLVLACYAEAQCTAAKALLSSAVLKIKPRP